jgi:hypothetical protein
LRRRKKEIERKAGEEKKERKLKILNEKRVKKERKKKERSVRPSFSVVRRADKPLELRDLYMFL